MPRSRRSCWFAACLCCLPLALLAAGCVDTVGSDTRTPPGVSRALAYPPARTVDQVDTYHGTVVADPYRWMEDEDSAETQAWVREQAGLFDRFVSRVAGLDRLTDRIRQIREYDTEGVPLRRGDRYFYSSRKAGAKHGTINVRRGLNGQARVVVDYAAVIQAPGHSAGGFSPSPDGRSVVWSSQGPTGWGWLDSAGVDGKLRLDERIDGIAGNSAIWTRDSRGFFYVAYGATEALVAGAEPRAAIYYHLVGTTQAEDRLVYRRDDRPNMLFGPKLSDDGYYLIVSLNDGTSKRNQVVYKDLRQDDGTFVTLIETADAGYGFEGNVGRRFFFQTTLDAPRSRLIAIDLDRPAREHWKEIIPEREATLAAVSHIGGRLVVSSTRDARPQVEVFRTDGTLERQVELAGIGLLSGFNDDPASSTAFYGINSLYESGSTYSVDLTTGRSSLHSRPQMNHDPDAFEIRQVFYQSQDGTRIPMFVAHRRDLKLDGTNPAFMYGYGHGGWVAFPWFQPHLVAWLELGGVYALPNLRGGGEYGTAWQDAGTRRNKQNTIDDFIAAAEHLVAEGYTSHARLVANGGSASGVLAAAAVVQRPELFGAALIEWPFLDMLRYDRFTVIKGWTDGYGTPDDPRDFAVLRGYSPLHNLRAGACYPPTLTVVGESDTSTVPMHGYKLTAALQALEGCSEPYLLKHVPAGGHYSYGTNPEETVRTQAEVLAFLIAALDIKALPAPAEGRSAAQAPPARR